VFHESVFTHPREAAKFCVWLGFFGAKKKEREKKVTLFLDPASLLACVVVFSHRKNDPAAGSPTATLLRLLLPLLKKYRWTSRQARRPISPTTCIAPSSETTTGGVYKWQGRNRHSLMSCAYETFLVARPIIAILGPKWVDVIPVIPPSFESSGSDQMVGYSCSH
jgi:hypothetical protein